MLFWSLNLEWAPREQGGGEWSWVPRPADMGTLEVQLGEVTGPVLLEHPP